MSLHVVPTYIGYSKDLTELLLMTFAEWVPRREHGSYLSGLEVKRQELMEDWHVERFLDTLSRSMGYGPLAAADDAYPDSELDRIAAVMVKAIKVLGGDPPAFGFTWSTD